jgi:hypothetical protein
VVALQRAHGDELIGERSCERLRESQLAPFVPKRRDSGGSLKKLGNHTRKTGGLDDGIWFHGDGLSIARAAASRLSE